MTAAPAHTPEAVLQALRENQSAPNGPLRNARAEELVAAAESTGDRDLVRKALFELITAYEFSTERGRMLVPFARLMQEWDKDPSAFDRHDVHRFHWMFKWVSSGMLTLPEIPLATIERWLAEMERRYRTAGYSERAVRQAEFTLAHETGDGERAARAFAAWTAADRDSMADCHACELNDQGRYRLHQGRVDGALESWAPVLDGREGCAEEPHRVLAESLLPLVRAGRLDAARAHHLRGHRLARGNESLLPAIGRHIEFCALTGNEGRGLEVLAEHAAHLASDGNPAARLDLLGGTLVLLRRLLALGHGDRPAVAYGGARARSGKAARHARRRGRGHSRPLRRAQRQWRRVGAVAGPPGAGAARGAAAARGAYGRAPGAPGGCRPRARGRGGGRAAGRRRRGPAGAGRRGPQAQGARPPEGGGGLGAGLRGRGGDRSGTGPAAGGGPAGAAGARGGAVGGGGRGRAPPGGAGGVPGRR
ncbi:hypothetical protein [Streptomyces sp. CC228A]|uniref:hypothetical protein n=1 Tax=Streptomyces sp. CC228A TaxID=2898186 RepID=UPI001F28DBF7|nr:hypothetical protein [Streptomyces sp. CC228A]